MGAERVYRCGKGREVREWGGRGSDGVVGQTSNMLPPPHEGA